MAWTVIFADEFERDLEDFSEAVQIEVFAGAKLIANYGPQLGRPHVDTLNGSAFPNMKEFRFRAEHGVWRLAFAFDPVRSAVLLIAGNKTGVSERRFYKTLIDKADERYRTHLRKLGL
ncbi:type II toxin-antitoxin system RelE/ParE family toxin [Afifella sp. YEN Y35]|uniref:type II toxin-antitoxin system RelE/ParE family toxin n=1 Tax=Afifella sp. YEN Y35 TaxID=3388337 RepID=UPI0039E0ABB2